MIKNNLFHIRGKIQKILEKRGDCCQKEVFRLIAVTKNHGIIAMREAIDAGIIAIGENKVQEAASKVDLLERKPEWHLIGHLQTNKVKQAVGIFDVIESVDSMKLAVEIDKAAGKVGKQQDIFIQVNIAEEACKFGVRRKDLPMLVNGVIELPNLRLCGFMTILPYFEDVELTRPLFREMYNLFKEFKSTNLLGNDFRWLSMGMTNDYEIAVEEGANIVRVGTGIFGKRS